jgi:hypothetical protein
MVDQSFEKSWSDGLEKSVSPYLSMMVHWLRASTDSMNASFRYANEFVGPYFNAVRYFTATENHRIKQRPLPDTFSDYMDLLRFNLDLWQRFVSGGIEAARGYNVTDGRRLADALTGFWVTGRSHRMEELFERNAELMEAIGKKFPQAIAAISSEFGFHFERGENILAAESDRFRVYQILPTEPGVEVRQNAKPVLIVPPYVLGANILAFLPKEKRSYTHCFANQGIPTYIRINKDIATTEAFQTMTKEDDARDTRLFCEAIKQRHGRMVTLNGYCQGGYSSLCNILSGQLDGLVDAFITCVAPMDGTKSEGLSGFLKSLPKRFNDLEYGTKTLPNGNRVADGDLMGWVYKLKSIENESPLANFFRDLQMFVSQRGEAVVGKTAAALHYWLNNERSDLPLDITGMSFASYNTPIASDGTLPVRLFGQPLNLKRIKQKGVPWLICYGEGDMLVEKPVALAPLEHVHAEVAAFPKGHVAMATSWSEPRSAYALHTVFGDGKYRGPVRFHLDLDAQISPEEAGSPISQPPKKKPVRKNKKTENGS